MMINIKLKWAGNVGIYSFKSIITSGQSLKIFGQKLLSVAFVNKHSLEKRL